MENVITFENVFWRRDGQEILKAIDWEVNKNEHWSILGLNGSGKTSLLNIVTGYNYPTSGKVAVLGEEFGRTNIPALRKRIGYVSSALEKFSHHLNRETVEAVVVSGKFASFGLYEAVADEIWEKANELISSLRLNHLRGRMYNTLSQGEKRKILIARALMSEPEILILDEPCSGLDVLSREEVLHLMNDIETHQCHLLYVTHHIEEITASISHVLLIRDGEALAAGPKRDVLTDDLLSEAFKLPVKINWDEDRPYLAVGKRLSSV